jgi:hypothetical protein
MAALYDVTNERTNPRSGPPCGEGVKPSRPFAALEPYRQAASPINFCVPCISRALMEGGGGRRFEGRRTESSLEVACR